MFYIIGSSDSAELDKWIHPFRVLVSGLSWRLDALAL